MQADLNFYNLTICKIFPKLQNLVYPEKSLGLQLLDCLNR